MRNKGKGLGIWGKVLMYLGFVLLVIILLGKYYIIKFKIWERIGAVEPLIEILKDKNEDKYFRLRAMVALRRIKDVRAIDPLIVVLKSDWDLDVQGAAALTLGEFGKPAVEPLIALLKEDELGLAYPMVMEALRIIGKPAVEPLIDLLRDENWVPRWKAAYTLGEIGNKRATEPLEELAPNDPESFVRNAALEALVKIRSTKTIEPLEELAPKNFFPEGPPA